MNYVEAQKVMATAKDRGAGKPLGNNTRLVGMGSHYAIRLHNTSILAIFPDGSYRLDSGGWRTAAMKARLNQHLPAEFYVFPEGGKWYLQKLEPFGERGKLRIYEFEDGMTIGPRGGVSTKQVSKKGKKGQ